MPRNDTIGAHVGAATLALGPEAGRVLLAQSWPDDTAAPVAVGPIWAAGGGEVRVERGQRFVVVRGIAFMPVRGLLTPNSEILERYLGWSTYAGLAQAAWELEGHEDVQAVVAIYDSPGGYVIGLEGAAQALGSLAAAKPLYSLVSPLAASAAYWLATTGGEIVLTPGAEVGSIGTMRTSAAYVQPDIYGVRLRDHSSSHARAKNPDPETEAGLREIQRSLDEAEARFHAAVAAGRGIPVEDLPARLSVTDDPRDGGAVFRAGEAIARGLADRQETDRDFVARVFAAHGPKSAQTGRRATAGRGAVARAEAAQALARI